MVAPRSIVTIYVRHSGECPHEGKPFYRGCECAKWLRYSGEACFCKGRRKLVAHRQHKLAAETRTWSIAEERRAEYQNRLDSGEMGAPLPPPPVVQHRRTLEQELETYLLAKKGENISQSVQRKLR